MDTPTPSRLRVFCRSGYQFAIDFGLGTPPCSATSRRRWGTPTGRPRKHFAAAVANCLSASLTFALTKFKQDPGTDHGGARHRRRNEANRLRAPAHRGGHPGWSVQGTAYSTWSAGARSVRGVLHVSMSVRQGIPIDVRVIGGDGQVLKG